MALSDPPSSSVLAKLQPHSAGQECMAQTTSLDAERSNYFCSVNLGHTEIRVILYFMESNPLGHVLLKRCRDADYDCHLVHNEEEVIEQLEEMKRHQAVIVVDACHKTSGSSAAAAGKTSSSGKRVPESGLEKLSSIIHMNGYHNRATLIGIVSDLKSDTTIKDLLAAGVSHVLTEEDCHTKRFELELQMVENTEAVLKERLLFSLALFEAVDQCNDAVQITGKDSTIMYINRSFLDLSGYTRDEVIGKPAMDILKTFDAKTDNGPRSAVKKGQSFDGICYGRRKSGSQVKQHLKLIPVKSTPEHVDHHVTIQRLLASHGDHGLRSPSFSGSGDMLFPLRKQLHLHKMHPLEIPITKVVQLLIVARDNDSTPSDVKEVVEKSIEILCSSELYAPVSSSGRPEDSRTYTGIVGGLLQAGSRWPNVDITTIARMSHPPHTHMTRNPPITPPPPDVQVALGDLSAWEFDIIHFERLTQHQPLFFVGMKVFKEFEICDVLDIEETVLASWLKLMERHYHQQNSYHNSTHAADVLQATTYFVNNLQDYLVSQGEMLERIEIAALLISAVIHDLDHPARTNPHLCNTKHELALLYNDSAVLENHHIALSFKLTQQSKDVNIFQNLDLSAYRTLRSSIIDLVLATDMSKHFEHLAKFNVSSVDGETGSTTSLSAKDSHEHRKVMKRILVKCADISNPCRPQKLCVEWAGRIAEEYFAQTEDEKRMKLPVVFPDFDRHTCKLPVTQVKFIDFFISGLFEAWHDYCPIPLPMEYLKSNYTYWKSQIPDSSSNSASEDDTP